MRGIRNICALAIAATLAGCAQTSAPIEDEPASLNPESSTPELSGPSSFYAADVAWPHGLADAPTVQEMAKPPPSLPSALPALTDLAKSSAPIAAAAAACGYWPADYWHYQVAKAQANQKVTGVTELFIKRFNEALRTLDANVNCGWVHAPAVDYLVLWARYGT